MQSMMYVRTQQLPQLHIFSTTQHVFCFSKHVNPVHSNTHVSYVPVFDPNTYKTGRHFFLNMKWIYIQICMWKHS